MKPMTSSHPPSLRGKIISQTLAFLVCVIVPGLVTAIAPVSWLRFQRQGDHVTARADTCFFFIIPFRRQSVDSVTGVDQRTQDGSVSRYRRSGKTDRYVQAESEGFLSIQGPQDEAVVSVTPADIDAMASQIEGFLKDGQASDLRLFAVANWKFSILAGGLASSLTVLYVGGLLFGLGQFLLRSLGLARA